MENEQGEQFTMEGTRLHSDGFERFDMNYPNITQWVAGTSGVVWALSIPSLRNEGYDKEAGVYLVAVRHAMAASSDTRDELLTVEHVQRHGIIAHIPHGNDPAVWVPVFLRMCRNIFHREIRKRIDQTPLKGNYPPRTNDEADIEAATQETVIAYRTIFPKG